MEKRCWGNGISARSLGRFDFARFSRPLAPLEKSAAKKPAAHLRRQWHFARLSRVRTVGIIDARCASNCIAPPPPLLPGCSSALGLRQLLLTSPWAGERNAVSAQRARIREIRRKVEGKASEEGDLARGSAGRSIGKHADSDHGSTRRLKTCRRFLKRTSRGHDIIDDQNASAGNNVETTAQDPAALIAAFDVDGFDSELPRDLVGQEDSAGCGTGYQFDG